ncbi:MAG: hypothetical protein WBI06_08810, partial [Paludibacter sp.]
SAEKLFYATEWLNLPAAGKLSEHLSIETQIVVQRKWSVIFKNLAFTPKIITINHYLSDFLYFFSRP